MIPQPNHPDLTVEERIEDMLREFYQRQDDRTVDNGVNHEQWLKRSVSKLVDRLVLEGQRDGMKQAKSRVLRRTEIPKDAKNPTRDATVILGEQIADIIEGDIAALNRQIEGMK